MRSGRFALFAECLLVGVLVTLSLPGLVTILPAFAAGCRHIRAHLRGESTALRAYADTFAAAWRGSLRVSVPLLAAYPILLFDLLVVLRLDLPGGGPVALVCAVAALGLSVIALRAAAAWSPGADWPHLVRAAARRSLVDDRAGTLWMVVSLGVLTVVTWQLLPLLVPMLGCLALAAVAVDRREVNDAQGVLSAQGTGRPAGGVPGAARRGVAGDA